MFRQSHGSFSIYLAKPGLTFLVQCFCDSFQTSVHCFAFKISKHVFVNGMICIWHTLLYTAAMHCRFFKIYDWECFLQTHCVPALFCFFENEDRLKSSCKWSMYKPVAFKFPSSAASLHPMLFLILASKYVLLCIYSLFHFSNHHASYGSIVFTKVRRSL